MSDERLRNLSDPVRTPRASGKTEGSSRDEPRGVSDDLRIEAFRARQFQYVLPDLPEIAGYSTIWVSTENPTDIQQKQADGYEFVHPDDIPGWNFPGASDAGSPGTVNVREMRAMKLRIALWNGYMSINHHEKPADMDSALLARIDSAGGPGKPGLQDAGDRGEYSGVAEIRESQRSRNPWAR
jgi:hypothetical protein